MPPSLVGALDQGTTSTRFILYRIESAAGAKLTAVASHQMEHKQIFPQPGWCEHDPEEIVANAHDCISSALAKVPGGATAADVACVGITNQRETVVAWDAESGKPLHNAIVWLDTRTSQICADLERDLGGKDALRETCGLPISTYFAGTKMRWLLDNCADAKAAAKTGSLRMGTVETWLTWRLTNGARFVTDCTNASRTMLMNLRTLQWDTQASVKLGVPLDFLPQIVSCADPNAFGTVASGALAGVSIAAAVGDQHAAALGQRCAPGEAKNTYGTGCFALLNTGPGAPVPSTRGLLSTVCWRLGARAETAYALEGSVAIAGAGVQWLRDNMQIITSASEIEAKARSVRDAGNVVFVPAFSGLFAPRWRADARGVIVGLTQHSTAAHVCRALLDAISFQTVDVLDAMRADADDAARAVGEGSSPRPLRRLRVDGGASANGLLMQIQADALGLPVSRPANVETTAAGAALAAGVGAGLWREEDIFADGADADASSSTLFQPATDAATREARYAKWADAIERSLGLA
jgi:glycerol kinase